MLSETQVRKVRPLRHQYKLTDGGGLYLLVAPTGGRYWRYNYRFGGKNKTLALGVYPDVPLAKARARHQLARQQLADGIDPCAMKRDDRRKNALNGGEACENPSRSGAFSAPPDLSSPDQDRSEFSARVSGRPASDVP